MNNPVEYQGYTSMQLHFKLICEAAKRKCGSGFRPQNARTKPHSTCAGRYCALHFTRLKAAFRPHCEANFGVILPIFAPFGSQPPKFLPQTHCCLALIAYYKPAVVCAVL